MLSRVTFLKNVSIQVKQNMQTCAQHFGIRGRLQQSAAAVILPGYGAHIDVDLLEEAL